MSSYDIVYSLLLEIAHYGMTSYRYDSMKDLLDRTPNIDTNDITKLTYLSISLKCATEIVELFVNKSVTIDEFTLHTAINDNNIDAFRLLNDHKFINEYNSVDLLQHAFRRDTNIDIIKLLVDHIDSHGLRYMFEWHIKYFTVDIFKIFVNKDFYMECDYNSADEISLIRSGQYELIKYILENNYITLSGYMPQSYNYWDLVRDPLNIALNRKNYDIVKLVIDQKVHLYDCHLNEAIAKCDANIILLLLDSGAPINNSNDLHNSLYNAITLSKVDAIKLLISRGATVNTVNRLYNYMFIENAFSSTDINDALVNIDHIAEINALDLCGRTFFQYNVLQYIYANNLSNKIVFDDIEKIIGRITFLYGAIANVNIDLLLHFINTKITNDMFLQLFEKVFESRKNSYYAHASSIYMHIVKKLIKINKNFRNYLATTNAVY